MLRRAVLLTFLAATPAAAADHGYFNCLGLDAEQLAWFQSGDALNCCNIADGMPTLYEDREDGTYVPPYDEAYARAVACRRHEELPDNPDHSLWVKIPREATRVSKNPIGVAVIWWTNIGYGAQHTIRCAIDTVRS